MPRNRRSSAALLATLLSLGLLAAPASASPAAPAPSESEATEALYAGQLQLQHLVSGLVNPVGIVNAADGTNRLFVVEQQGTVRVIVNRQLQAGYFLDLRGMVGTGGERGLLGLAFHPQFESNRKVFAFFTDGGGDIQIGEFTANDDGGAAGADTYLPILTLEHTANTNHNGGQLMFGPDGALYAFVGDGGGSLDENGQDDGTFLGKMLKLVPNLSGGLAVPAAAWAKGLRNPWRASFDRANGDLWIGDVGQGSWEEINRVSGNPTPAGVNYGWNCREGMHSYAGCGGSFTDPVVEYSSAGGGPGVNCSVTGGYVYRGPSYLDFAGQYVLGDFCTGNMWTVDSANTAAGLQLHLTGPFMISSFGEDERGELYVAGYDNGAIYKVVAPTFNDVIGSPFVDDITWLDYQDISNGCGGGSFCPAPSVTRAEMAAFLLRAIDHDQHLPAYQGYFADVPSDAWYTGYVEHLAEHAITLGCGNGNYCPDSPVTRDEMASFLARALGLPPSGTNWFSDDEGNVHEDNINRVADAGITLGCGGGQYCPGSATTREQMAAFIRRALTD